MTSLTLASASETRAHLLRRAGLRFSIVPSGIDEDGLRLELGDRRAKPRDVASLLAQAKALEVAPRTGGWVIGADQTLELSGETLAKTSSLEEVRERLVGLRGRVHTLHSAVAIVRDDKVLWRYLTTCTLRMKSFTQDFLEGYLERNGPDIRRSLGGYCYEGEGVRLFDYIEGDYFSILGLPLVELFVGLRRVGALAA